MIKIFPWQLYSYWSYKPNVNFSHQVIWKVTLKSTTIRQCYTSKIDSSNRYLINPWIHNDSTSDHFRNTIYDVDALSIDNKCEFYAIKGFWRIFEYSTQQVIKSYSKATCRRNRMKYFSNEVIWTRVSTTKCIIESSFTCWPLLIYWSEWCRF